MTTTTTDKLAVVLQSSKEPLDARFRALFALKGLASQDAAAQDSAGHALTQHDSTTQLAPPTTLAAIKAIDGAFENNDSVLLKHELAYVLGQIQHEAAIPVLERVLRDEGEHPMVRHEAAEAMGAISSPKALPILRHYLHDSNVSVRETCELALRKIEFDQAGAGCSRGSAAESEGAALARAKAEADTAANAATPLATTEDSLETSFLPIDPAPAHSLQADTLLVSIPKYRAHLTAGESLPLFERYRAMFSLRNAVHAARRRAQQPHLATQEREVAQSQASEAIEALAEGLTDKSALFRHEICFVFGELAHPACIASMVRVLSDHSEEDMVRHEAAEALGAVVEEQDENGAPGSAVDSVMSTLRRWADDASAPRVVRESCVVALDEMAYNNDPTQFQPIEIESA